MRWGIVLVFVFAGLNEPDNSLAASFDCQTNRAPVEQAICINASLSALDDEMASAYRSAMDAAGSSQDMVRNAQRVFLRQRDTCGTSVDCIRRTYQRRLAELYTGRGKQIGSERPPSFDCSTNLAPVEQTICASPSLSALDAEMDIVYRSAMDAVGSSQDVVRDGQRAFLRQRNSCGSDASCIRSVYALRLNELQSHALSLSAPPQNDLPPGGRELLSEEAGIIQQLKNDDGDASPAALADRYIAKGQILFAERFLKSVINDLDYKPAEYLQYFQPPMWSPPHRMSNRLRIILTDTYPALIKLLITQGRHAEALEFANRARSRMLEAAMLKRSTGAAPNRFSVMTFADIKALAAESRSTFVFYASMRSSAGNQEEVLAWVVKRTGEIAFESLPLDGLVSLADKYGTISGAVNEFTRGIGRGVVERVMSAERESTPARIDKFTVLNRLHKALVQPLERHLPEDPESHVIIIPDDDLFLVPFNALMDSGGRHLIERHTISVAPSIAIYALLKRGEKVSPAWQLSSSALVVGDPKMPLFEPEWGYSAHLPQLPGSAQEARVIGRLLGARSFTGSEATEREIVGRMQRARVIHLATHGLLLNSAAMTYSYVSGSISADLPPGAIALGKGEGGSYRSGAAESEDIPFNGFLSAGKVLTLNLDADLVTLSACDTARGRVRSQQFVGLPSAFLASGARSVVMTLWSIPDSPTAEAMEDFYKLPLSGRSRAAALREAMLLTKAKYADPQSWAAFTLIGLPD